MTLPKASCQKIFSGNPQRNTELWSDKVEAFVTGLPAKNVSADVSPQAIASLRKLPEALGAELECPTFISIYDEGLMLEFNFGEGERVFIEIEEDGQMTLSLLEEGKMTYTTDLQV